MTAKTVRRSLISRFFEQEMPGLERDIGSQEEVIRLRPPAEQALLYGWLDLRYQIREIRRSDGGHAFLDACKRIGRDYLPTEAARTPAEVAPLAVLAAVAGVAEDDRYLDDPIFSSLMGGLAAIQGEEPPGKDAFRIDTFLASCKEIRRRLGTSRWGSWYEPELINATWQLAMQIAPIQTSQLGVNKIGVCAVCWQKLFWAAESVLAGGALLGPNRVEPWPGDPAEQVAYLVRLQANQPQLVTWPALARFVPAKAERLLPLTAAAYDQFLRSSVAYDDELASDLGRQIRYERHYQLDHLAVIELDGELGIERIVLAPERRDGERVAVGFLLDHQAGSFFGETYLLPAGHGSGEQVFTNAPAISTSAVRRGDDYREAQAVIELVVLSAWRDIVVAEVREQQYEMQVRRKAKAGKRSERAALRGDLTVIHYLPRRVVYRRAETEVRRSEGRQAPRRLYPVGAYAKRLGEGWKRSAEAEQFAAEIRMPLADYQTVVRPHWRGGSDEERQAAMESHAIPVRHWKSWSAIDLLRTRVRSQPPRRLDDRDD